MTQAPKLSCPRPEDPFPSSALQSQDVCLPSSASGDLRDFHSFPRASNTGMTSDISSSFFHIQDGRCHAQDQKVSREEQMMSREEGEGLNDSSSHLRLYWDCCICYSYLSVAVPGTVSSNANALHRHSTAANLDRAPGQDRQQQSWFFQ